MSWPGAADDPPPSNSGNYGNSGGSDLGGSGGGNGDGPTPGRPRRPGRPPLTQWTEQQADEILRGTGVAVESLPQLPLFAPLFGYTVPWQKAEIAVTIDGLTAGSKRRLSPDEANAIAYHRSKLCARVAWAPPITLLAAAYFTNRSRSTFRFPFYTPAGTWFHPTAFPTATRPLITGPSVIGIWHVLRFGAYGFVCKFFVSALIGSYAATSCTVGIMNDPRLQEVRHALREARLPNGTASQPRGPLRQPPNAETPVSEDSAPYRPSSWRKPDEEQSLLQQQEQEPPAQSAQPAQWTQRAPDSRRPLQDEDDSFLWDDASPVAPTQRQEPQRPSAGSPRASGEGSVWDRIRQRAQSEEGAPWNRGQQQPGEPRTQQTADQYTYAPSEQEKAYAKQQAQKEFDAMLERERRGMGESGERR